MNPMIRKLVAVLAIFSFTHAQAETADEQWRNFDQRRSRAISASQSEKQGAIVRLRTRIPDVQVDFDEILHSPRFVRSTSRFLSEPELIHDAIKTPPLPHGATPLPPQQMADKTDRYRMLKRFLNDNADLFGYDSSVLNSMPITRESVTTHSGLRTVVWQQHLDGIPIFEALLIAKISRSDALVSLASQVVPDVARAVRANVALISAAEAVALAARNIGQDQAIASDFAANEEPTGNKRHQIFVGESIIGEAEASLIWLPIDGATLKLCWRVVLTGRTNGRLFQVLIVLAGFTVAAWHWRKTKPHLLVGWLWFIGALVPVIGIVQVGGQAMADRYTYLPHIGLLIAIVYELAVWSSGFSRDGSKKTTTAEPAEAGTPNRNAFAVVAGAIAFACLAGTTRQLSYWKDSETLFTHTLAVTRDNAIAHINLGVALEQQGRLADARTQYEAAAKLDPNRVQTQVNLANVLDASGETEKALEHYRMALQLNRNSPLVHINFGSALVKLGRFDEAKLHYDEAKRLATNDPRPAYLMGKSLLRQGRSQEAVVEFKEALRIDPNHLQTLVWFARTRATDFDPQVRHGSDGVKLANQAAEMTGENDPFVLDTLAAALAESGRFVEAEQTLQRALQLLSAAGDTNTTALTARLQLYRLKQPYRESFTNAAEGNAGQR